MKLITAVLQPSRLETVKGLLMSKGITGMTVIDVQGVGRQKGRTEIYRGHEYKVDLLPKVKIELAVPDALSSKVVETIVQGARSGAEGKIGDGKIFISPLEQVVRIRTGETGEEAL
jgi:nitrogen regulatory protein PII